jgi:membrane associated rhomboid family serine protease
MEPSPDQERPFRVCEACGRLTPSSAPWCVECGAASVEALAEEQARREERRFAEAFFARGTPMTWALLGANVGVFALMMSYTGGDYMASTPAYHDALANFGAKVNPLINAGEYWRLLTPIFIHIGIIHLLINMYSLYVVGQQVERLYGGARTLIFYLLTGVAGVVASYAYSPGAISAGASGAIFGLVGVLFSFGIRYRSELPGVFRRAFGAGVLPTILLNLWIGYTIPGIDNAAHIGGLVAGAVLALVVPYQRPGERRAPVVWRVLGTLGVIVAVACFGMAAASPKRTERELARMGATSRDPLSHFVTAFNDSGQALNSVLAMLQRTLGGQPLQEAAVNDLRERASGAAEEARSAAGVDARSKELLGRQADLLASAVALLDNSPPGELTRKALGDLQAEERRLDQDWQEWFKSNGAKFGLTMRQEPDGGNPPA